MNNSKIAIEYAPLAEEAPKDYKATYRQRETELIEIIEALKNINSSKYWQIIQAEVFEPELKNLQKQLNDENNPTKMYRLQGEIKRAEKLNLSSRLQAYELELQSIRSKLNANN